MDSIYDKTELKLKLQEEYINNDNIITNNYAIFVYVNKEVDEHFIDQSIIKYMYDNNIIFIKDNDRYKCINKLFYYYDYTNKILYLDIRGKIIFLEICNIIKDNNITYNNNIIHIMFGSKSNNKNINKNINKIIRFIQRYYSIIYIINFGRVDYLPLYENNNFIFYRKYNSKYPYPAKYEKRYNNINYSIVTSRWWYSDCKKIFYNKLLYTFISIISKNN